MSLNALVHLLQCVFYLIKFKTKAERQHIPVRLFHYQVNKMYEPLETHTSQTATNRTVVCVSLPCYRNIAINVLTQFAPLVLTTWFCVAFFCSAVCSYWCSPSQTQTYSQSEPILSVGSIGSCGLPHTNRVCTAKKKLFFGWLFFARKKFVIVWLKIGFSIKRFFLIVPIKK